MLWLKAQQPAGFVDGQHGFVLTQFLEDLDAGEDFGCQFGAASTHHGIGGGNDEGLEARFPVLQGAHHGKGAVPGVDVAPPEVPFPERCVGVEGRESVVILGSMTLENRSA